MDSFKELMRKALGQLEERGNNSADTSMFRGIGYALLALAVAIKEKKEKKESESNS